MKRTIPSFFISRMFVFIALMLIQIWVMVTLMYAIEAVSTTIQYILTAASLLFVLWVVNRFQNPAYKIAWIILILILPVFGMTMYVFFSQRTLSAKEIRLGDVAFARARKQMPPTPQISGILGKDSAIAANQSQYIALTSDYPVYTNTDTKYYPSGEAFYHAMMDDLTQAKKYIFMEYFIVQNGVMWDSILELLEKKAAEGVDVRFMYDDMGCINKLPARYYRQLEAKGIRCTVFNPIKPVMNSLFNNRDHRKITVIDGTVGYCSSANLADEYINERQPYGHWKDATVRLQGDGVLPLAIMFLHLWMFSNDEIDEPLLKQLPKVQDTSEIRNGYVQPFQDSPFDDLTLTESLFINMIARATRYIYINTPYLILGNELTTVLITAAQSGVDVRITVPHIPDKRLVFWVTQSNYTQLVLAGVKIYEYTPGFIHSKTFLCDDEYGIVGTANLDFRSLYLHFECGVWMYRTSCLQDMKQDYLDTVAVSQQVTIEHIRKTNIFKRFIQAILRIFGPLM